MAFKSLSPIRYGLTLGLILLFSSVFAQENFRLKGKILDPSSKEPLIGATIYVQELEKGTMTDVNGAYELELPEGKYTLKISYLGNDQIEKVNLNKDLSLTISMTSAVTLQTVKVTAEKENENTSSTKISQIELGIEEIKNVPAFMGEVDILKAIQYLPGVQSAGEGNSGFYVRGGGPDQNLILLDGATVYNASHLFGFFSVFNADALDHIELTKGGIPAEYGGRLSSILDIKMKKGGSEKLQSEGGIGSISSRFTLHGPIKKKTNFLFSARRTYIDILMKPVIKNSKLAGSGYFFYDLNGKINHRFSDKDFVSLSGYFGNDVFSFKDSEAGFGSKIPWGNTIASFNWKHIFTDKALLNTSFHFTDYDFSFEGTQSDFEFKLFSGIKDYSAKIHGQYSPNVRHKIKYGLDYTFHTFIPSNVSAKSDETEFDFGDIQKLLANEGGIFVQDDYAVTEKFKVNAGLRYSVFQHMGPFTRYEKDPFGNTTGTKKFQTGEHITLYDGIEPRISMRYQINDSSSVKAGFTQNYQYIHMASISPVSLPTDIWIPSSDIVLPQFGRQINLGYFRNFLNNSIEASIEIYYKTMDNLVEYKEGAEPADNLKDNVDNQLVFGDGRSYGAEFFLKKNKGDFTGWVGYTLSKTDRVFENINNGERFPAKYDRRHDLSIISSYELNKKWKFGLVFVFATGDAITLPEQRYFFEGKVVSVYGDRNSQRMVNYHRMDVSATFTPNKSKTYIDPETGAEREKPKKMSSSWNFSIYNIYNRANPYFIYFDNEGSLENGKVDITAKQVSLFPIIPAVTWNYKF